MDKIKTTRKNNRLFYTDGAVHGIRVSNILNMVAKPGLGWWRVKCSLNYVKDKLMETPFEKWDGILIDRIQKILKEAKSASSKESGKATKVGSAVHSNIEKYLKGEEVRVKPTNDKEINAYNAFKKWVETVNIGSPVLLEHKIFYKTKWQGHTVAYGGQVDFIGPTDNKNTIIDWKTSKTIYPTYELQLIGYKLGYEQMTGKKIDKLICARLDKYTGEPEIHEVKDVKQKEQVFLSLLRFVVLYNKIWK